jgi:hypothetical protein
MLEGSGFEEKVLFERILSLGIIRRNRKDKRPILVGFMRKIKRLSRGVTLQHALLLS